MALGARASTTESTADKAMTARTRANQPSRGRAPKATALQRGKRARVSEEPAPRLPSPPERSELEAAPFEEETAAERKARDARSKLTRFGWTDRARGRVHVPLEVALDLYLGAQGHSP